MNKLKNIAWRILPSSKKQVTDRANSLEKKVQKIFAEANVQTKIQNNFKKQLACKVDALEKKIEKVLEEASKCVKIQNDSNKQRKSFNYELVLMKSMIFDIYEKTIAKKICPICKSEIATYLPYGVRPRQKAQCPICLTVERHRLLWKFFERKLHDLLFEKNSGKIKLLHFAPEKGLADQFRKNENIDYFPVDINPNYPGIVRAVDITDIPYEDNYFDLIICSHVIEHIPNEKKALMEMRRVLKPSKKILGGGGIAIINAPVNQRLEKTFEDAKYDTPELREKYYGQSDHVRTYGKDYMARLQSAGFEVTRFNVRDICTEKEIEECCIKGDSASEDVYVCQKF